MSQTNITFFVTSLDSGGIENYLLRFLQFKSSGFNEITVFCKSGQPGQLEKKYRAITNVKIHLKKISFLNPRDFIYIFNFFKRNKIDAVCDFSGNFAGLILYTAKIAKISKRVAFYRGSDNHFKESKIRLLYNSFVKRMVLNNATDILSNSKAAFDFFHPKKWQIDTRFKKIYNGLNSQSFLSKKGDLRLVLNIPKNAFVIGHVGRFNMAKNHETILKVANLLCTKYQEVYFLMCGNGVRANLEPQKNSERIILSNYRSDIPQFLNTLDCFYFPSLSEGQPNALIEAMMIGVPFVASNIASILETVPVKYHNLLVAPKDHLSAYKQIEGIMNKVYSVKFDNLQAEIADKFNAEKLFNEFYQVLQ